MNEAGDDARDKPATAMEDGLSENENDGTFGDDSSSAEDDVIHATVSNDGDSQARRRGAGGSRRPSCLSVGEAGGAKVPLLNALICFLIVNMIQRRSYKLKAINI